jgi:hypothetical protein
MRKALTNPYVLVLGGLVATTLYLSSGDKKKRAPVISKGKGHNTTKLEGHPQLGRTLAAPEAVDVPHSQPSFVSTSSSRGMGGSQTPAAASTIPPTTGSQAELQLPYHPLSLPLPLIDLQGTELPPYPLPSSATVEDALRMLLKESERHKDYMDSEIHALNESSGWGTKAASEIYTILEGAAEDAHRSHAAALYAHKRLLSGLSPISQQSATT